MYEVYVGETSTEIEADTPHGAARRAAGLYHAEDPDFVFVVCDGEREWSFSLCSQWAEELLSGSE